MCRNLNDEMPRLCQEAIWVVDPGASNLSGMVRSWADALEKLWNAARSLGKGTDWVNRHSINRLYAEQAMYLCSGTSGDPATYTEAFEDVKWQAAQGPKSEAA